MSGTLVSLLFAVISIQSEAQTPGLEAKLRGIFDHQKRCETALEEAANGVRPAAIPNCPPLDPVCNRDIRVALEMKKKRNVVLKWCLPAAKARCADYAERLKRRESESDAWARAMNGCGKGVYRLDASYFSCICKRTPKL